MQAPFASPASPLQNPAINTHEKTKNRQDEQDLQDHPEVQERFHPVHPVNPVCFLT
jgi:hypothetical protein